MLLLLLHCAGSVIAVSHDRYFLKQIATRIVMVENGKLVDYKGDYEVGDTGVFIVGECVLLGGGLEGAGGRGQALTLTPTPHAHHSHACPSEARNAKPSLRSAFLPPFHLGVPGGERG